MKGKFGKHQKVSKYYENDCTYLGTSSKSPKCSKQIAKRCFPVFNAQIAQINQKIALDKVFARNYKCLHPKTQN